MKKLIKVYESSTRKKTLEVEAEIVGQLAVHPQLVNFGESSRTFTITHLRSGGAVTHLCESEDQAKQVAVALDALDWTAVKSYRSARALAAIGPKVKIVLKQFKV